MDVDAVDEDGWTPLHAAVYWGNMEAAAILVQGGASLDIATKLVCSFFLISISVIHYLLYFPPSPPSPPRCLQGETLSDLCDSQDELEILHKLNRVCLSVNQR